MFVNLMLLPLVLILQLMRPMLQLLMPRVLMAHLLMPLMPLLVMPLMQLFLLPLFQRLLLAHVQLLLLLAHVLLLLLCDCLLKVLLAIGLRARAGCGPFGSGLHQRWANAPAPVHAVFSMSCLASSYACLCII